MFRHRKEEGKPARVRTAVLKEERDKKGKNVEDGPGPGGVAEKILDEEGSGSGRTQGKMDYVEATAAKEADKSPADEENRKIMKTDEAEQVPETEKAEKRQDQAGKVCALEATTPTESCQKQSKMNVSLDVCLGSSQTQHTENAPDIEIDRCPRCNANIVHTSSITPAPIYCRWKVVPVKGTSSLRNKVGGPVNQCIACGWDGHVDLDRDMALTPRTLKEKSIVASDAPVSSEVNVSSEEVEIEAASGEEKSDGKREKDDAASSDTARKSDIGSHIGTLNLPAPGSEEDQNAGKSSDANSQVVKEMTDDQEEKSGTLSIPKSCAGASPDEEGCDDDDSACESECNLVREATATFTDIDQQLIFEQSLILSQLRGEDVFSNPLDVEVVQRGRSILQEIRLGRCGVGFRTPAMGSCADDSSAHDTESTCCTPVVRNQRKSTPGCFYEGSRDKDGFFHGTGQLMWENGDRYVGRFEHGMRQGTGRLLFADGSEYDGWWRQNKMHGHGVLTSSDGCIYIGLFAFDRRNGRGTYLFSNGDSYVGGFKDDFMEGQGTYYFQNESGQNETFEGTFCAGRRNGWGKYHWPDGKVDVIRYENEQRVGTGVRFSANRKKMWKLKGTKALRRVSSKQAKDILSTKQHFLL